MASLPPHILSAHTQPTCCSELHPTFHRQHTDDVLDVHPHDTYPLPSHTDLTYAPHAYPDTSEITAGTSPTPAPRQPSAQLLHPTAPSTLPLLHSQSPKATTLILDASHFLSQEPRERHETVPGLGRPRPRRSNRGRFHSLPSPSPCPIHPTRPVCPLNL